MSNDSQLDIQILSSSLNDPNAIAVFSESLNPEAVGKPVKAYGIHHLYSNMVKCYNEIGDLNPTIFNSWLENYPEIYEELGGKESFDQLVDKLKMVDHIEPISLVKLAHKRYGISNTKKKISELQQAIEDDQSDEDLLDELAVGIQARLRESRPVQPLIVRTGQDIADDADSLWEYEPFIPTPYAGLNDALGYDKDSGGIMRGNIYSVVAISGLGKPLHVDTMITMADGSLKRLGDITVGDKVLTHLGNRKKVTAVHEQGELPTRKIQTNSGRSIISALDHTFLTSDGWVQVKDFNEDTKLKVAHGTELLPSPQSEEVSDEEARLLGYFVGDGSMSSGNCNIVSYDRNYQVDDIIHCGHTLGFKAYLSGKNKGIGGQIRFASDSLGQQLNSKDIIKPANDSYTISAKDREMLILLGAGFSVETVTKMYERKTNIITVLTSKLGIGQPRGTNQTAKINSLDNLLSFIRNHKILSGELHLADQIIQSHRRLDPRPWLSSHGLWGSVSSTKRVPVRVRNGCRSAMANFIGAYFACDGTINHPRKGNGSASIEFYSISEQLLVDVQNMLAYLDIASTISIKKGSYKGNVHYSFRLRLTEGKDSLLKFARLIPLYSVKKERIDGWIERFWPEQQSFVSVSDFRLKDDVIERIEEAGDNTCRCLTVEDDHSFIANGYAVHNSTLVKSMCNHWLDSGYRVLFINFEESRDHWERILMTQITKTNAYKKVDSAVASKMTKKFKSKMIEWGDRFMIRHDPDSLYYEDLELWLKEIYNNHEDKRPDIVVIDTIQSLFTKSGGKARWGDFEFVMVRLEKLAKEMNAAFILTAQQNSNALKEGRTEVNQSDMGGSVTIVQKSSVVMMLMPRKDDVDLDSFGSEGFSDIVEIHMPKNRITGTQSRRNPPLIRYNDETKTYEDWSLSRDFEKNKHLNEMPALEDINPTIGIGTDTWN